jgi:uncharacterized protein YndB with AHSA1/START domain
VTAFDPQRDLLLERVVDVPPELVWDAWTQPEHVVRWFTPVPWRTTRCTIDLRPGGEFTTVMESPEGDANTNTGCYLELVPQQRLVWTTVLGPGFRPTRPAPELAFTAVITLERAGTGTKYTALAMHGDPDACARHETQGFHAGWGTALDQLVALFR